MGRGEWISSPPESSGVGLKNKQPCASCGSWHRGEQRQREAQPRATPSDGRIYGSHHPAEGKAKALRLGMGKRVEGMSLGKPFRVGEGFSEGFSG